MKIVVAGGGTGGHIYPGIALARALADRGGEILFIGTPGGPEASLVPQSGFAFEAVRVLPRARGLSRRNVAAAARLAAATWRSLGILGRFDPDVVVGMGGYVSLPVALAAALHRIPLVVHEQNAVPGLANRIAARVAAVVAVSFPGTEARFPGRGRLVGNPVRREIASLDRRSRRAEALAHFGLEAGRRTLLIFGGSQGARSINTALLGAYDRWRLEGRLQVLHLAGAARLPEVERDLEGLRRADDRLRWETFAGSDRMDLAYAAADLAVCRAGATTIAEIAAVGLPALLAPLPHALDDDQRRNAEAAVAAGGAEMILDADLASRVAERVESLIFDDAALERMSASIASLARADAAERLADLVQSVLSRRGSREFPAPVPPDGLKSPAGIFPGLDASWRHFHLVGIGGAGMSAIARVLADAGLRVTGSDLSESSALRALRERGLSIEIGHREAHLEGADVVIFSAAIREDNPELEAARRRGIPVLSRGEALARVVEGHRTIAVTGTHGKSTTAAMAATILEAAGRDPTFLIGADLAGGPGGRLGAGKIAVVEADEAYGSFLHLHPAVAVLTNVDEDHLDHYGTMDALEEAFARFLSQATETIVVCADHERARLIAERIGPATTYGFGEQAKVRAAGVATDASGSRFDLIVDGRHAGGVALHVAGWHNVQNALGAAAACLAAGVDVSSVAAGLARFVGARRRFEYRGSVFGVHLVDDYAHLPGEIEAILDAARHGPWSRILAVFQPHLYSRTRALAGDFGSALAQADVVVVTDVYAAREDPVPGVSGKLIVEAACEAAPGKRIAYLPHLDEAAAFVASEARSGDLVLTLGAGDITTLPDRLLGTGASP